MTDHKHRDTLGQPEALVHRSPAPLPSADAPGNDGSAITPQDPSSMPRAEDDALVHAHSPEFNDLPGSGKHRNDPSSPFSSSPRHPDPDLADTPNRTQGVHETQADHPEWQHEPSGIGEGSTRDLDETAPPPSKAPDAVK